MFKILVLSCDKEPQPGQRARIGFKSGEVFAPILRFTQNYVWVFVPKSMTSCYLIDIQGAGYEPPNKDKILTFIKREFYFDIFYWVEYWKSQITAPLLIELPSHISYGKLIPSQYIDSAYPWYSQYIAALEEIESLGVSHRVISDNYPHAIESLHVLENSNYKNLKLKSI